MQSTRTNPWQKRVVVLGGAGAQAAECVKYLAHVEECQVIVADLDGAGAHRLAKAVDADGARIKAVELDISDSVALQRAVTGCDVVANFVGPYYRWGGRIAGAAIAVGAHYVDICDDGQATLDTLKLSDEAADAKVTVLTGMGSGPGVTNILAGICAGNLERVHEVEFNWFASGDPRSAGPAAFEHLLWGFGTPFTALIDGRQVEVSPLDAAHARRVRFPDPYGDLTVWPFPHPEPLTFERFIPGLTTSINRGAAYPEKAMDVVRAWHLLGYAEDQPVKLQAAVVRPSEFAVAHHIQHASQLDATDEVASGDASGMLIRVAGECGDVPTEYQITAATASTMAAETGVPAAVGIAMLLAGEVARIGVIAPECLDPAYFFARFARRQKAHEDARNGSLHILKIGPGPQRVRLRELITGYRDPVGALGEH